MPKVVEAAIGTRDLENTLLGVCLVDRCTGLGVLILSRPDLQGARNQEWSKAEKTSKTGYQQERIARFKALIQRPVKIIGPWSTRSEMQSAEPEGTGTAAHEFSESWPDGRMKSERRLVGRGRGRWRKTVRWGTWRYI
jgi:hypothetical protein